MSETRAWLEAAFGGEIGEIALYERALTHGSAYGENYERLEFLGDRVLGLVMANWLYERFHQDEEGRLSRRLNTLVSGGSCADVARKLGVAPHLRLGKQARDDGASDSDNVLGDVMEALIGAHFLRCGLEAADTFIRKHWEELIEGVRSAPRHPKSALQEWAAANDRKPPQYALLDRSGPQHAPLFVVRVSVPNVGEAEGQGSSKQEAETNAASALLEQIGI